MGRPPQQQQQLNPHNQTTGQICVIRSDLSCVSLACFALSNAVGRFPPRHVYICVYMCVVVDLENKKVLRTWGSLDVKQPICCLAFVDDEVNH